MTDIITLRWPVRKWEKAPFMCRMFGHVWRAGWWGYLPYLRPISLPGITDGIDRCHVDLTCKCDRCGAVTTVARAHNWEKESSDG